MFCSSVIPSQDYTATQLSTPIAIATYAYTGGKGFTTLSLTPANATSLWGILILRSLTEITVPSYAQTIIMLAKSTATPLSYTDSPLSPGTYHYRAATFNTDGTHGPILDDHTISVS